MRCQVSQDRLVLRANIELVADHHCLPGCHGQSRTGIADDVVSRLRLPSPETIGAIWIGNPSADEIMLEHGDPATRQVCPEGILGHVFKIEFGKALVWLGQCGAQEGLHTHPGIARYRCRRAVAFQLHKRRDLRAHCRRVADRLVDGDRVASW